MQLLNQATGYAILLVFAVFVLAVALRVAKNNTNLGSDFLNAKNSVPFGVAVASLVANWTWSATLLGGGEGAYSFGVSGVWIYGIDVILSALIFAPLVMKIRNIAPQLTTFPEFIRLRVGKSSHIIFTVISMAQMLCFTLVQVMAIGLIFNTMFGIPHWQGAIIGGIIITSFVAIGGLRAAIDTSFVFVYAILLALFVLLIGSVWGNGGPSAIFEGIRNSKVAGSTFLFSKEAIIGYWLIDFFTYINYTLINQNVWEHVLAVKPGREKTLVRSSALIWFFIPAAASVIGLVGLGTGLDIAGNDVLPAVILQSMPQWASYLFVVILLASIFSTASTCLNAFTNLLVTDIYKQYMPKAKFVTDEKIMHKRSVIIIVVAGALVSVFAVADLSILWLNYAVGAFAVPLLWPFVMSAYKETINKKSIVISLYAGVIVAIFFAFLPTLEVYTLPFDMWIGYALIHVVTLVIPIVGTLIKPDREFRFEQIKDMK